MPDSHQPILLEEKYEEDVMNKKISASYSISGSASSADISREIAALDAAIARGDFIVMSFNDKK